MAIRAHIIVIAQKGVAAVTEIILQYAAANNMHMTKLTDLMSVEDGDFLSLVESANQHVSILCRMNEWHSLLEHFVNTLDVPILHFEIFEHDYWRYDLYSGGNVHSSYTSSELFDTPVKEGDEPQYTNALYFLRMHWPNISHQSLENYFIPWKRTEYTYESPTTPDKSYSDDKYTRGDAWQLADFMRRLVLQL